ncbi:MAG: response regulator [Nitrospinota bacterium]|jgi:CheY-like chemotaxis protein|nr:response regulator [Nitrospinota bacterium]MDH5790361.1 response regulator [Nitrospinota bacterium]
MTHNGQHPILIAEDDEDDYLLTIEALKEAGVDSQVKWVKDGEELMNYLEPIGASKRRSAAEFPSLILLDLNMPRKDGREVLEEIKKSNTLRKIPVVILTTSKAETDINHAYDLGVNSYIQKPVRFNEFVEVIKVLSHYWFQIVKLPD